MNKENIILSIKSLSLMLLFIFAVVYTGEKLSQPDIILTLSWGMISVFGVLGVVDTIIKFRGIKK